jgi:leader peptidase (prepilin peptidase) / N-methyltransferase
MFLFYIFVFIFGTILGSFINVLIYRIPREENFVNSRSKCPHCQEILKWYDLVPLLSFLILRGKCRNCHHRISWSYFLVELYSGLIFLTTFVYLLNDPWRMLAVIFISEILLILFMTDLKELFLPDSVILVGVAGVLILFKTFNSFSLSHLLSAVIFFIFFGGMWFLSKGKWLGLGDGKLMFLIGLAFGTVAGVAILYGAIILGTVVALTLLISKKANLKTRLPMGSFICLSATVYIFVSNFLRYDILSTMRLVELILRITK